MDPRAELPRRRLETVDLTDLALALESSSDEMTAYLDLEVGDVVWVSAETWRELEEIEAEILADEAEPDARREAFESALARRALPDWIQGTLREADVVFDSLGKRYIRVERTPSRAHYDDMAVFIESVANPRLREQLSDAIRGRGAFRRFNDLVERHSDQRERWFTFKDERMRARALEWLAENGIEPAKQGD